MHHSLPFTLLPLCGDSSFQNEVFQRKSLLRENAANSQTTVQSYCKSHSIVYLNRQYMYSCLPSTQSENKKFISIRLGMMALLFVALFFGGMQKTFAQSMAYNDQNLVVPIVTSDKDDYAPGEIAHITGTGWVLDTGSKMVHVEFKEEPDYPDFHIYDVNVDAEGNWSIDYVIEERHLGVKFTVIAKGKQSLYIANHIFYDANLQNLPAGNTIAQSAPLSYGQLGTTEYNFSVSANNTSGNVTVTMSYSGLPADLQEATFSPSIFTLAPNGSQQVKLTLKTNSATKAFSGAFNILASASSGPSRSTSPTLLISKASPIFSDLTPSQSIEFGTSSVILTGKLANVEGIPATGSVTASINGVASSAATLDGSGNFTITYNTATLPANNTAYPITYNYNTTTNFAAASDITKTLKVNKAPATVTLGNLSQPYTGSPLSATATTNATGTSSFTFTYNGSSTPPTAVGSYAVVATLVNTNYSGSASGTLEITQAVPSFTALAISQNPITYGTSSVMLSGNLKAGNLVPDGTVTATINGVTSSPGVSLTATGGQAGNFNISYTTASLPPGDYSVTFNYAATGNFAAASNASLTLSINKTPASVALGSLSQPYDGNPKSATATTTASGTSSYNYTYTGTNGTNYPTSSNPPTNAGSYTVVATLVNDNYSGSDTKTMVITKATPSFTNLGVYTDPNEPPTSSITFGTGPVALKGIIKSGSLIPDAGSVTATINGASAGSSPIDQSTGEFLIVYNGSTTLPASTTPYQITYSYATTTNFAAATNNLTSLTVNKISQTITFGNLPAKQFGDAAFNLTATASSGLPVSYSSSNQNVATISGSTVTIVGAGTSIITASQAGNANVSAAASVPQTLTVNKADPVISQQLTTPGSITYNPGTASVTLTGKIATSGGLPPATGTVTASVIDPNTNTVVRTSASVSIKTSPQASAGTFSINFSTSSLPVRALPYVFVYTYSGDDDFNGSTTLPGSSLTITKANQTITFQNNLPTPTYGDAPFQLTATASSGLPVSYSSSNQNVATISGSTVTIVGAGTSSITASQPGDNNYNAAAPTISRTLTVNKKILTVTADDKSKVYGEANPTLTASYSGFVLGQTTLAEAGIAGSPSLSTLATPGSGISTPTVTYTITAANGGLSSFNYQFVFVNGTLTITPRPITIDVTAGQKKVYGESDPVFAYTYSPDPRVSGAGLASGDAFSGALTRDAGQTVGGSPYAINRTGLTIVRTSSSVDVSANYNITYNGATFAIERKPASVTPAAKNKIYGNADPALTGSLTGFLPADNVTAAYNRTAGEAAEGNYVINATLSPTTGVLDNYDITYNTAAFTIDKRPLTINVTAGQSKVYGEDDPIFAYTLGGGTSLASVAVNDDFSGGLTRQSGENVGSNYNILQNGLTIVRNGTATDVSDNYNITYVGATFAIGKRPLTITVNAGQTKVYGQNDPLPFAYTYTPTGSAPAQGLATGDAFSGALTRDAGETVGNYNILQTGLSIKNGTTDVSTNYNISFVNTNKFSVTKRPITIDVTAGQKKVYGESDPVFAYTYSPNPATNTPAEGLAFTDAFSGALTRGAGQNVGSSYTISQGTLTIKNGAIDVSSNYTITYNGAMFEITKRPLTIYVTAGQNKVYGNSDPLPFAYTYTPTGSAPAQGLATGDAFSGALTRDAGETVGNYNILQTGLSIKCNSVDKTSNYDITFSSATFAISKRPLTINVAAGQSKVYGENDPAFAYTLGGGTSLASVAVTDVFTGALSRTNGENVGSAYAIQQGSLTIVRNGTSTDVSGNYNITYNGATFAIGKRPITITVTPGQSKVYGQDDPVFAYTYTPTSAGVGLATAAVTDVFSGALARDPGNGIGTYNILKGSLTIVRSGSATDVSANYTITFTGCKFTINPVSVSSSVTVSVPTQQYSDLETFTATIVGGAPLYTGGPQAAQSATFKVGTQTMGTANFVVSGLDLVATLPNVQLVEPSPFGTLPTGQMAPSTTAKTVTATIAGADPNYNLSSLSPTTSLTITKEDARITYTGAYFTSTSSTTSSTATVTLSATIQDISAVNGNPGNDLKEGDIRNAKVYFTILETNQTYGPFTPGLVTAGDTKTGTVTTSWSANIGTADAAQFTVKMVVDNYYTRDRSEDDAVITVAKPVPGLITGGGFEVLTNSAGIKGGVGTEGTKNNFGFNVKNDKNGAPKGTINTIVRKMEAGVMHVYQIKGNAMTSLAIVNATASTPGKATFNGKASIQDITNPLLPVSVGGNSTLQVTMTDMGEPGKWDKIGITVWDNAGGLWFSNNFVNAKTVEQQLDGGNLKVLGSPFVTGSGAVTVALTSSKNPSAVNESVTFTATVAGTGTTTKPTGSISFIDLSDANKILGTVPVSSTGTATFSYSSLTSGTHVIQAYYGGDSKFGSFASVGLSQVVVQSTMITVANQGAVNGGRNLDVAAAAEKLSVKAFPNPAISHFNLNLTSNNTREAITLKVFNQLGQLMDVKRNLSPGQTIQVGAAYKQGTYLVEVTQGTQRGQLQVVKAN
jgi:hypothetical protein